MNTSFMKSRGLLAGTLATGVLALSALTTVQAASPVDPALDEVRFGVPPWPGITVKSEVASQLLQALGYSTQQRQLAVSVILNSVAEGDLEAYLAGWYPQEEDMLAPLLEEGSIIEIVDNVPAALTGIAVTADAWEAGVRSIDDLDEYADRFDSRIYGIEAGSGINDAVLRVIDNDRFGLGDWQLQESSSPAMLAQVGQQAKAGKWAAFIGWRPHWMNVTYDMHYLKDVDDSGAAELEGRVASVVRTDLAELDPNVAHFFEQYVVGSEIQSEWINAYSRDERPADEVASEWIAEHEETVAEWLDGVTALDGTPAMETVRGEF